MVVANSKSLLAQAKQGDAKAIAGSLQYLLKPDGLLIVADIKGDCLQIAIQGKKTPNREKYVPYIEQFIRTLELASVTRLKISGMVKGMPIAIWTQEVNMTISRKRKTTKPSIKTQAPNDNNWWDEAAKSAQEIGNSIVDATSQAGQTASKFGEQVGQAVDGFAEQASQSVEEMASQAGEQADRILGNQPKKNKQPLDLAKVPEDQLLAFYGALFAIATIDGNFDKDEFDLIFGILNLEAMSEEARKEVYYYVVEPPTLSGCLAKLTDSDERLRYGLMVNLIDTVCADDEFSPEEQEAIVLAQEKLGVDDEQVAAIEKFVDQMRTIRERGLDDNYAADATKAAASGLAAVGVPIAAIYFSGSVIGLSAAGITSGLASLGVLVGLGGMVPGIGLAVLAGAGIFAGVKTVLDKGDKRRKKKIQAAQERRAQLIIENLQNAINTIVERISQLQTAAADADANREAVAILTERMRKLNQSVNRRKRQM